MKKDIKLYEKLIISLLTIFIIVITLWITIIPITKSKSFYMKQYKLHNTSEVTGYNEEELSIITDKIIAYLFEETDDMQVQINGMDVFSNQALYHMRDVRDLYIKGQRLAWLILGLFILASIYIFFHFNRLKKYLLRYSIVSICVIFIIILIFASLALIDFNYAFELFHHIIFPSESKYNDAFFGTISNYPEKEGVNNRMLILILSNGLFMNVGLILLEVVVVVLVIWFGSLIIINKLNKKNKIGEKECTV